MARINKNFSIGLFLTVWMAAGIAVADEPDVVNDVSDNSVALNQNVVDKISNQYSAFLGDNAESVVTGLRTGNRITLRTPGKNITTTFFPTTGQMGYGNVSHAIVLAQEQLAQYGITEPTGYELKAALVGGYITTPSGGKTIIEGVLIMRSQGMGWGEIAHEYGVKLGHVISSTKSGKNETLIEASSQTSTGSADINSQARLSGKAFGKGIVTGSGESFASAKTIKVKNSHAKAHAYGQGIVSAIGVPIAGGSDAAAIIKTHPSNGHADGHGISTATGASVSASGISHGSHGATNGLAKGHSK